MRGAGRPSVKLNEMYRLQSTLAGLLGIFILLPLTPLVIDEWTGYAFPLGYVSCFSLKPAVSLTFVAHACTGLFTDASLTLMLCQQTHSSNLLLKQGTI